MKETLGQPCIDEGRPFKNICKLSCGAFFCNCMGLDLFKYNRTDKQSTALGTTLAGCSSRTLMSPRIWHFPIAMVLVSRPLVWSGNIDCVCLNGLHEYQSLI